MKIRAAVVGFAVLYATAAAGQQRQQFDLLCQGTSISKSGSDAEVEKPWSDRIRVDLASQQWCKGSCFYINPIAEISPDELRLNDKTGSLNSALEVLDRRTGTFRFEIGTSLGGGIFQRGGGACRVLAFSGFPARQF